ncbi:MAG: DJ-1/PfpI family protein [Candidatus Thorarchaeota archaeon]
MELMKGFSLLIIGIFLLSFGVGIYPLNETDEANLTSDITEIEILFLMDHEYGANYHFIRPILEGWGWNITIAGTAEILDSCTYQASTAYLETDILISEVDDITQYDAISIMPGDSHDILRTNQTSLNLIQSAEAEGLVVSAWCKAVRVLAAADVIDGKNITGNADYVAEYEAAGAIFNELVPPVIDGNIVTGVRSRFYRTEMCQAIATALGVFETDPPEISSLSFNPSKMIIDQSTNLTSIFTDASGISYARAEFFLLDETGMRGSNVYLSVVLDQQSTYTFTGNITGLEVGNYTMDITVRDIFSNSMIYSDVSLLVVELPDTGDTTESGLPLPLDTMLLVGLGGVGVLVAVVVIVKMKKG